MYNKVIDTIKKYNMLEYGDKVVVGISGGVDSSVLINILHRISKKMNISIFAVHINHGIRGEEANSDELFVKEMCFNMNITFFPFHFNIKQEAKNLSLTEEEAGRLIRYRCFESICKKYECNKIAVAHNMNDNAETIFMRLIRGTGIKGLSGIPPKRQKIIRPLIFCTRNEIEDYSIQNNIEFKTDYTNFSDIYTRNKIRLNLIPWIENNMNSEIIKTISKTAQIIKEEDCYLEKIAKLALNECIDYNISSDFEIFINSEKLKTFDDIIKRRIIRAVCRKFSNDLHDISFNHVEMICSLIEKQTGKTVNLPFGLTAVKNYKYIKIFNNNLSLKQPLFFSFDMVYNNIVYIDKIGKYFVVSEQKPDVFSDKAPIFSYVFNSDKISGQLKIRNRVIGDKIFISKIGGNKKIKNLFIDLKIPRDKRDSIPILADDNGVICVVGLRISDFYKANKDTKNKIYLYCWEDFI